MKKIMIVDDYDDIHEIIPLMLEGTGYQFKSLFSYQGFEQEITLFKPDLLILDVNIGDFDGRDLCNQIKNNPHTKHIKVLMMSATAIDFRKYPCQADGYFEKPFEIDAITRLINSTLQ